MSESSTPSGPGGTEGVASDALTVGDYRLGRRVGADVFGDIYVGTRDGASAVVTVLHDRIVIDRVAARRFAAETAVVSDLAPWGVIPTLDFDFETTPRWIASASASGQLLRQRVEASGPLQPDAVRLLASRLARALQALHSRGVTQRDLSPDSVLLGPEGAALWHSGWAGLLDGSEYAGTSHTEHVEWLAPEQFTGDATGPPSDIHAWAVTLLYAATGFNPFASEKASLSVSRLMRETPLIPAVFDPVLASLLAGGLMKDPASRPTARDLVSFLDPGAPLLEPSPSAPAMGAGTQFVEADPVDSIAGAAMPPPVNVGASGDVEHDRDGLTRADRADGEDDNDNEEGASYDEFDEYEEAQGGDGVDSDSEHDDSSNLAGRRIGLAPLIGLGALVVAAGSVVGIVIGRALGG